jgi:hypothetical protein
LGRFLAREEKVALALSLAKRIAIAASRATGEQQAKKVASYDLQMTNDQ